MLLLTKPSHYKLNEPPKYEEFNLFKLAVTERNWVGHRYITKKDCEWFVNEMKSLDEGIIQIIGKVESLTDLDIILDTSVFAQRPPFNSKLIEFLEGLESINLNNLTPQEMIKIKKKIKYYSNQLENWSYLYRWSCINIDHALSKELIQDLEEQINQLGDRGKKLLLREGKKAQESAARAKKKGADKKMYEYLLNKGLTEAVTKCEENDANNISKILKYAFEEPSLFLFSAYIVKRYFKQSEDVVNKPGHVFISIERKKNNIEIFLKDSTEFLDNLFLIHQAFLDSLPKTPRNLSGTTKAYFSLHDLKMDESYDIEDEKIDVLKTIVSWVAARIPEKRSKILPNNKWIHFIKGDLFKEAGIKSIRFEGDSIIGGPNGPELIIKAVAYTVEGYPIMFPVFDPDCWEDMNARQSALVAYAICLYHDICIESNYTLNPINDSDYEYELVTKDMVYKPHQDDGSNHKTKNRQHKEVREEHWVSFHFRKLGPNHNASEEAKTKAHKYGIKRLPTRFTFVDSFVRGEKELEPKDMRISALDVLNRTLGKMDTFIENTI